MTNIFAIGLTSSPLLPSLPMPGAPMRLREVPEAGLRVRRRGKPGRRGEGGWCFGGWKEEGEGAVAVEEGRGNFDMDA